MTTIRQERLKKIANLFQIEETDWQIEPYGSGHINDTFRLTSPLCSREYILQRMNGRIFKNCRELMNNVMRVTRFLQEKIAALGGDPDREALQLIFTKDGQIYYAENEEDVWRMYLFIRDTQSFDQSESPEQCRQGGWAFGNFQYLLSDFPAEELYETIEKFHDTPSRFARFQQVVREDPLGLAAKAEKEIQFLLDREADCAYFTRLAAEGKLPLRVTHNDTKLNNVLFDKKSGKAICVIDLDTVMPGFAAHDFGDVIRSGASTAAEDEKDLDRVSCSMELFEAYVEGFLEGCRGSLTDAEIDSLPMGAKLMTMECGMRFLTDYLEGDVYFKIHYPGQNLDRARTQLKLVKDMEEKWPLMESIVKKYHKEVL